MQYPLETAGRRFGRRGMRGCSMAVAAVVFCGGSVFADAMNERTSLRQVPPPWEQPIRLPAVQGPAPQGQPTHQAWPPTASPLAQPDSIARATLLENAPPPGSRPVRLPPAASTAPSPQYFGGLARDPDEVLSTRADRPVRLVSLARNLEDQETAALPPEEPIGQAPPDTSQVFLRSVTVLLQPGQIQFDWGAQYVLQKTTSPGIALVNNDLVIFEQEVRDRRLLIPFAARLGVAPRVQAFVRAPVGWAQAEYVSPFGEITNDTFNVADVNAGVNLLLCEGRGQHADLIGTVGFTAPTGKHPFGNEVAVASLGDGFWAIDASLLWVRSYDPVVVFWGVGYRHLFERSYLGLDVAPGDQVTYNLGVGFAINERITLSSAFIGQYVTETKVNRNHIPGSDREPMSVRMALTAITGKNRVVEPYVRFGLADEATNADFGIVVTESF